MDVILISFAICILGVMVTVLLFSIAMRPKDEEESSEPETRPSPPPEGFFMDEKGQSGDSGPPRLSVLEKLERHFRLEQKAAERFLEGPSPDSLHAPSDSPLWL